MPEIITQMQKVAINVLLKETGMNYHELASGALNINMDDVPIISALSCDQAETIIKYSNDQMQIGCLNPTADLVPRSDKSWSDDNLNRDFTDRKKPFSRLKCRACGAVNGFEILGTDSYETSARCKCGMYYIVHSG